MYLQECCLDQGQQSASVAFPQTTFSRELIEDSRESMQGRIQFWSQEVNVDSEGVQKKNEQQENEVSTLNTGISEIGNKFEKLFKSHAQCTKKAVATDLATKRCLIVYDESDSKIIAEESLGKLDVAGLQQVSAHAYYYSNYTIFVSLLLLCIAFSREIFQINQNGRPL